MKPKRNHARRSPAFLSRGPSTLGRHRKQQDQLKEEDIGLDPSRSLHRG